MEHSEDTVANDAAASGEEDDYEDDEIAGQSHLGGLVNQGCSVEECCMRGSLRGPMACVRA